MVVVLAIEILDVQRDAGILGERLEPLAEKLGVHVADFVAREGDLPDQVGPPGNVDRHTRQRLVHGQMHIRVARDPRFVAERLGHRLAEHDAGILGGVVEIDVQVALGLDT